ncbi:hypothetical protein PULV_a2800 [Pseudoalteromonas ulvae UL12]|nr:hypothetical protein [Pseudoalteromonas ulvae]MBE0364459.1 hypothetical protein [Pseudoalteromonas ulvae UL12]
MSFWSTKRTLYLLLGVTVLSMTCFMYALYAKHTHMLTILSATKNTEALTHSLLLLRRHEKDFMLRHKKHYLSEHQTIVKEMQSTISQLKAQLAELDVTYTKLNTILNSIQEYQVAFAHFAQLHQQKYTLMQDIEAQSALISNALADAPLSLIIFHTLSQEIHQALLLPRFDAKENVTHFEHKKAALIAILTPAQHRLFEQYETLIYQLFTLEVKLGSNENKGAEGQLRTSVHFSEQQITQLSLSVRQETETQLRQSGYVMLLSLTIMHCILISLLVFLITRQQPKT